MVKQRQVAGVHIIFAARNLREINYSHKPHAVGRHYENDVRIFAHEIIAVIQRVAVSALLVASAVNENHDGLLRGFVL